MRSDLVIDGFAFGEATVEGDDATEAILRLYRSLKRDDVNLMLLSGCIISLYNIVDVDALASDVRGPGDRADLQGVHRASRGPYATTSTTARRPDSAVQKARSARPR